jgi:hypothetical protein
MTRARDVANIDGILTTTGDTYYASAAATPARLGIGSTGNVLTVSGGVPVWSAPAAGGMTSIATGSLTGSSVSITSIPGTYKELLLVLSSVSNTNANYPVWLQHNSVTSSTYSVVGFYGGGSISNDQASINFNLMLGQGSAEENTNMAFTIRYPNYTNTSDWKRIVFEGSYETHSGNIKRSLFGNGLEPTTSAITSIQINSQDFDGGTYILYGVS